jgi:hypothetical protein
MELLIILIGVSIPILFYLWRESQHTNPATRWPDLAEMLEFSYEANPPRLQGDWKGRQMTLTSAEQEAVLTTPLSCRQGTRIELGPKADVEREAGMVVHDRIDLHDPLFEKRYLLRSTPPEVGEAAVDPSMRQRLLGLTPNLSILAGANRLDVRLPIATESDELRTYFDIAASLADSIDGS